MPPLTESTVNVTPLIDIVMVLVIFFMLVAKIGISTGAEAMPLPSTLIGVRIDDLGNTLTLNVHYQDLPEPIVTTLFNGQTREISLRDSAGGNPLLETLRTLRQHNPEFKVILRANRSMPYRYLEPILRTCAEAGIKSMNYTTQIPIQAGGAS